MKIEEETFSEPDIIESYHLRTINGDIESKAALVTYNVKSKFETRKLLDVQNHFNHESCVGQLPDDELFFVYPDSKQCAIIINTKSFKIRNIQTPWTFKTASCIYFLHSLYVFGFKSSFTGQLCGTKYDFIEKRWIKLSSFEMVQVWNCHCESFKNSILISSINIKVHKYDINVDSYSVIPIDLPTHCVKILLVGNSRVYIILPIEGCIYESGVNDEYFWNKIPGCIFKPCFNVYWKTYYKNSLFFGVIENSDVKGKDYLSYYQFLLKTKKLKKLKCHQNPCCLF